MKFSDFGQRFVGYSGITHLMDDLNKGLSEEGMIMMGGGNPAAIPEVIQVIEETLESLHSQGDLVKALANYDGPQGNDAFLETLAEFFQKYYDWPISRRNIALTHGSQSSFFVLFNSYAGRCQGSFRHVLIPLVPEYIGYCDVGIDESLIKSQQARIQHLDNGFFKYHVDFGELEVDASTGLICVSRPTNPSGNVLTDSECLHLDQIAKKQGVPLIIDNAYGTPFPNIIFNRVNPFWNENTIVCMSLSKLGLPGVRTGIVIANEDVIKQFTNATAITSLAPAGIGPTIVNQLIRDETLLPLCDEVILPFYKNRAELAVRLLQSVIPDQRLHIHQPEGSMFLWLWFESLPINTTELYHRLKRKGLLVVPGKYFFPGQSNLTTHAESCIRINYVQSETELRQGIEILASELQLCWGASAIEKK